MRIALFSDTFAPQWNGVANTVKNSARALGELGHEVHVYTISEKSAKKLTEESKGMFTVVTLPSSRVFIYPGERLYLPIGLSLKNLRKFKPDIIHVHTPFSVGLEGVLGAKIFKIPVVGTHHTFFDHYLEHIYLDYAWARSLSWKSTVLFYNRMDLVISPTKSLGEGLLSNGLKKPLTVLSNSINMEVFKSDGKKAVAKKNNKSIVYFGRVSYEKSIDIVVLAVGEVVKKIPDVEFVIVGDGPEKEKLIKLVSNLHLENNVIFTGLLQGQSLVRTISESSIFITASTSENMPLAVLEAESVGLPIIAISSLGMSEIIENNGNGFLLPHKGHDETISMIADAIIKLLKDDKLRESFSRRSFQLSEQYSEKEVTKKLLQIYNQTIESKKSKK